MACKQARYIVLVTGFENQELMGAYTCDLAERNLAGLRSKVMVSCIHLGAANEDKQNFCINSLLHSC